MYARAYMRHPNRPRVTAAARIRDWRWRQQLVPSQREFDGRLDEASSPIPGTHRHRLASATLAIGWHLTRAVPAQVGPLPADLDARAVTFPSESGSTIHGWIARAESPRAVVLLPPVRSDRRAMLRRAVLVRDAGYASLLIDFQATGESAGDVITFGWRERLDVLAARQFVSE